MVNINRRWRGCRPGGWALGTRQCLSEKKGGKRKRKKQKEKRKKEKGKNEKGKRKIEKRKK